MLHILYCPKKSSFIQTWKFCIFQFCSGLYGSLFPLVKKKKKEKKVKITLNFEKDTFFVVEKGHP